MKNKCYEDLFAGSVHRKEYYIARKFVLSLFGSDNFPVIGPNDPDALNFVFEVHSGQMFATVRQIALLSHFPNFDEETGAKKTTLTILCPDIDTMDGLLEIKRSLSTPGYLGRLLDYCESELVLKDNIVISNKNSFIDIKIEIKGGKEPVPEGKSTFVITESVLSEIDVEEKDMVVDISDAMNVNAIYNIGVDINNLPSFDFANISAYKLATDVFRKKFSKEDKKNIWSRLSLEKKCSNLYCADCLRQRYRFITQNQQCFYDSIDAMARSEHSRWNVEELILGFRPLMPDEKYKFSTLIGKEKDNYRKSKRDNEKAHLDLCSYHELRRINPGDMRYDYFLMLAAKYILR